MNWTAADGRGALRWTGAAVLAFAPVYLLGFLQRAEPMTGWFLALVGIGLVAAGRGDLENDPAFRIPVRWRGLLLGALVACSSWLTHLALESFVSHQPRFPFYTGLLRVALAPWIPSAVTSSGDLSLSNFEGNLQFAPSADKMALVPFAAFLVAGSMLLLHERRKARGFLALGAVVAIAAVLRGVFLTVRFTDIDNVLASSPLAKTEIFQRNAETMAWLAGCAIAIAGLRKFHLDGAPFETTSSPAKTQWSLGLCLGAGLFCLALGGSVVPSGAERRGRVLVDDRFCGVWEPAARRLSPGWYGDFPTYSFTSAVEWLGYHFAVSVNAGRPYTDELLKDYDIVVLKTPSEPIPPEDEKALLAFAERGGSLFLIGDHTNLLGMSSRLNRFSERAGIRFRFDSVMEAENSAFSFYQRPALLPHPAVRSVRDMEFMTSCSIAISGPARSVMTVPCQIRQDHDYAGSSFFGHLHSDPRMDNGPLVLAAEGPLGKGRVLAFSDSTVLSSFAVFEFDREKFLVDALAFLNREQGSTALPRMIQGIGILCLLLFVVGIGGMSADARLLMATAIPPVAVAAGLLMASLANSTTPAPLPWKAPPRISVLLNDTEALYPAVLGSSGSRDLNSCFDTMLASIPRSGVMPRMTDRLDEALEDRAILILNPAKGWTREDAARVKPWVEAGGVLIVGTKTDHVHADAMLSYLAPFGIGFTFHDERIEVSGAEFVKTASPRMSLFTRDVGKGKVLVVAGTQWWSRQRMGHCFNIPGADARACYDTLEEVLGARSGLAPSNRRVYRILED